MPNYQEIEANHLREPEQEESEVSMSTNENSPAGAVNTNEGLRNNFNHKVYLLKHSDSTRHTFDTWSGESLPRDKYFPVLMAAEAIADIWDNGAQLVEVNPACAEAMAAETIRRQQAEAEQEQRRRDEANRRREENEIIHRITGMDLVQDDLPTFLLEYRREGKDFQPFLDAMQALDDLALKRAGLTSWDEEEGN